MKLNRTSVWIRWAAAVLLLLSSQALFSAVTIREGKWYCIEASYNDTLLTGFEATFTVKAGAKYEAWFSLDSDTGLAKAGYQISAAGDQFLSKLPKIQSYRGWGWSTMGAGDTTYYYALNCSEEVWNKAGGTALGWGYPTGATTSRILFNVVGDSTLILKSPDQKTVLTYSYGVPRIPHNPVLFRVQMDIQKQLGNFNPGGGDLVAVRGDFNGWAGNSALMSEGSTPGVYELTIDFNYGFIDKNLTYKFFIIKSGGSEQAESDPVREFVLKAHGQQLGIAYFDRRLRVDVVNSFVITDGKVPEMSPASAYNSRRDEFILVWEQEPSDVYGRIFKADGTPSGPAFPVAASPTHSEYSPQVDYNTRQDEYMVVWAEYFEDDMDIYGVRLDHSGKKLVSPGSRADSSFAVCDQDSTQYGPKVAYNYLDNCFLVVWEDFRNTKHQEMMGTTNLDIYGQRVAGSGALLPPGNPQDPKVNFPIVNKEYYDENYPDVAYCGMAGKRLNEWLVVFERSEAGYSYYGTRIWGVRVKGSTGDVLNTYGSPMNPVAPGKAAGGVVGPPWNPEFPIGWDCQDFWAMIHYRQGSPHTESNDDPGPAGGILKANGARFPIPEFFVEWTDFSARGDIFGQRVAYFPDSTAFRLGLKPERGPDSLFTAVLVDRKGDWPENPPDWITWPNDAVTDDPFFQSWGNIAYGSTDGAYLVAWNDWRNALIDELEMAMPAADVYGQRLWLNPADSALVWMDHAANLDVSPSLNTPIAFTEADEGNRNYPAVAFGGKDNSFLVAYQYTEGGENIDIYANIYKGTTLVPSGIDSRERGPVADFGLGLNYPNPFNPETTIQYSLAAEGRVQLKVFDLLGREVATLVDERRSAGGHTAMWNGRHSDGTQAASGVYLYRLHWSKEGRSFQQNGKMVLIR